MDFNHNAGLINFGNTCFMNASLQLLMCSNIFNNCNEVLSTSDLTNYDINKYLQTWKDYMNTETKVLGPMILYHRYMILNKNYTGFTQEDAHEFITFTLDDISEQIKIVVNSIPDINLEIKQLYSIKFLQSVFYKKTSETSNTDIHENFLNLSINDSSESLNDCLELYLKQEEDDFIINYKILELPRILFIGLKRFKVTNTNIQKITKSINIPFTTNIFDQNKNYTLKGFIMHSGGIFGGHYYSYGSRIINNEIKWFCYNDSNVSEVSIEQVENELKSAYVFLYTLN